MDFSEEADFVYENRAYRDVFNAIVEKDGEAPAEEAKDESAED